MSFFSGMGALDLGMEAAGFRTWMACEPGQEFGRAYAEARRGMGQPVPLRGIHACSITAFLDDRWQHHALQASMGEAREETGLAGFVGGPPCPDFSTGGRQAGGSGMSGRLTQAYADLICRAQPDFFLLENVRGLASHPRHGQFYAGVKRQLEAAGYVLTDSIMNTLRFWVPQDRWRLMLAGFRADTFRTVQDPAALAGSMAWSEHAWEDDLDPFALPWPGQEEFVAGSTRPCPEGIPVELTAEGWFRRNRTATHGNAEHVFRPATQRFATVREGDTSRKSFKRLHRWRYSPTVAYGNNEVHLHPYEPRRLSVAEALALQTMPEAFRLPGDMALTDMFKTVGNAVPYMFAEAVGYTLASSLIAAGAARAHAPA